MVKLKINFKSRADHIFEKLGIDLVYLLDPSDLSLAINRLNYIFTIWDLCFYDSVEFPEVYSNREFERRERLYRLAIPKAVAVVTDSESTKQAILKKYGMAEKRVISLSFLPLNAEMILKGVGKSGFLKKHNIVGQYIFYPAQFWPHKNHIYILEGLKLLKEKYKIELHAVFTGSDKGNLHFILNKAEEFKISNLIHYLGFVDDVDILSIYAQSLALVMPTYFGPTNIPPIEAFAAGCPVLYSDLPELRRSQLSQAVLFIDLKNPESMCHGLLKIIEKSPEVSSLIANGRKIIAELTRNDQWEKLSDIFDNYALRLKCRK
jgi:glycosyltransferase involved in cell wall biosynthesis